MNTNSNVFIHPAAEEQGLRGFIERDTGMRGMVHVSGFMVLTDSSEPHGEFFGAAEYFVDPKGVA